MAAAPRFARPFVAVFIATLVVCALAPLNLWPFSNWELFSRLRSPLETSWEAVAVERGGRVVRLGVAGPTSCAALLRIESARSVSIYRVQRVLSERVGRHAALRRTVAATCTAKDVHASS
jgi:hypothetical protein